MAGPSYGAVPFREQIEFFRQKRSVLTDSWLDVFESQHDTAFMVAGANRTDLLADFREAIDRAIAEGGAAWRLGILQLVFFDLDGTITRRDTLFPYVLSLLVRRPWSLPRLLAVLPALLRFATGRADHGELKGQFIRSGLGGLPRAAIAAHTARSAAVASAQSMATRRCKDDGTLAPAG